MGNETQTPKTKPCLECHTENQADAATCSACGGGSFQHVLMSAIGDAMELAARELQADWGTPEAAKASWAANKRPPNMCWECPAIDTPCVNCWKRAGYDEAAYEERFIKPRDVSPFETLAEGEVQPPETLSDAAKAKIEEVGGQLQPLEQSLHPTDPPAPGHDGDEPTHDSADLAVTQSSNAIEVEEPAPATLAGVQAPTEPITTPKTGHARGKRGSK